MLYDKLVVQGNNYTRETIGLIGTHHGTGVTHTGLMLTFYMAEELGKKTAFLECNNHHDMSLIQSAYEWSREEELSFSFHRITCFKEVSVKRIANILSDNYECVILDFGTDFLTNRDEFLRCDKKIVVGGQAEWSQQKLIRFINAVWPICGSETWQYVIPYANSKIIKKLKFEMKRNIFTIPFEEEPTVLSSKSRRFFAEMFRFK